MWTTKRVMLLVSGFAAFMSAYLLYAHFLGGIDGLPPLPPEYVKSDDNEEPPPHRLPKESEADRKLKDAFGPGWKELIDCKIKLEVPSKNLVLAAKDFLIQDDGRVRLAPFHLAIFGKETDPSKHPEINTVKSDVAYLTFDRPIANITEMGGRKMVAGELAGNIMVKNNRRSGQQDDDLSLSTPGPMYYREDQDLIWTIAPVHILDTQSKPEPTTIRARGMDIHLTKDSKDAKPARPAPAQAAAKKNQPMSGVDSVQLRSTVEMHLWVEPNSGLFGSTDPVTAGADKQPPKTAKNQPDNSQEKSKVVIRTEGPFNYDVITDQASFEIPKSPGRLGEKVTVTRQLGAKRDELLCERLDLQFQRKSDAKADQERSVNLAIQSAHATGREVTLISEGEGLHAIGNDFFHDAHTRESILKGTPQMVALKDGHEIHARELCISNTGKKDVQQARAKGPGQIHMLDRASGKRTNHAVWRDTLEYGKDGAFDILVLIGDAAFEDQQSGQWLKADRLKVWLQPAAKDVKAEHQRLKPHHLEATGHVTAHSEEMHVIDPTEHLLIWFKDLPVGGQMPRNVNDNKPASAPTATGSAARPGTSGPRPTADKDLNLDRPPETQNASSPPATPAAKKPIVLSARAVESFVFRTGEKNQLDKLWCEGDVKVRQEPTPPEDKPVDIRGKTLKLNHSPEGSVLVVTGDLAQVQLNKITIIGPEVNIDQKTNKAWVVGTGLMRMPSKTNFGSGEQLHEPTELTVHWNKDMFFNGSYALFHGGIQAEQEQAKLLCQEMQVFLDRPVSFKEGDKGKTPAKVKDLVCDKSVRIEDKTVDAAGKLLRYTRLTSPGVAMNNEDGRINASGPGVVHILQLGPEDETGPAGPKPGLPARPAEPTKTSANEILKLTRVNYVGKLFADNNKRTATFYESVEVVHLPANDPDVVVDIDHPPPGCMYLRCEQLKVFSHRVAGGHSWQEMEAIKKVVVQSQEFWGVADIVKYDESKELVIFESGEGGLATLYRTRAQGAAPEKLTGKKIYYWRRTNEVKIEGGRVLGVN